MMPPRLPVAQPDRCQITIAWRSARCATALLCLTLLIGCASGLLPKPPTQPTLLLLDGGPAGTSAAVPTRPGAKTLIVETPRAAAAYDTRDLAYTRRGQQIAYYAYHQWADKPTQMLAPLIVRAAQGSGAFRAVVPAPTLATGAFRLETELLRLQQDFTRTPSRVQLSVRAVLIDTATRQVLGVRLFDIAVDAPSEDAVGGASAANQAVAQWLPALATFMAQAIPP
jgi:cholesterol transport system auxiliary component